MQRQVAVRYGAASLLLLITSAHRHWICLSNPGIESSAAHIPIVPREQLLYSNYKLPCPGVMYHLCSWMGLLALHHHHDVVADRILGAMDIAASKHESACTILLI